MPGGLFPHSTPRLVHAFHSMILGPYLNTTLGKILTMSLNEPKSIANYNIAIYEALLPGILLLE